MARLNWQSAKARDRAARQGAEPIDGFAFPSFTPTKRPSKAALRAEVARATAKITRLIKCQCGHSGQIVMSASRRHKRLRCSKCGALQ